MNRALGHSLGRARYRRQLSRAAVTQATGLHESTVQKIEEGTSSPRLGTLLLLASAVKPAGQSLAAFLAETIEEVCLDLDA